MSPTEIDTLRVAFMHHQAGRLDEAEACYRQVLADFPDHDQALLMLGLIVFDKSDGGPEAEELFTHLLALNPAHGVALHYLGRIRQNAGDDRSAVDFFHRAIAVKPDLAPIYNDLAVALNRLGRRDEAVAQLDRALELDPNYAVAHSNRGMVLFDLRRHLDAAHAHLQALAHTPIDRIEDRKTSLLNLSFAAIEAGELAAAERACRAILELEPKNADAIDQLAKVLDRQLRDDEALALRNQLARDRGLVREGKETAPEATVLLLGAVGAGHVPTRYLFDPAHFTTLTLNLVSPDQVDAPFGPVPWDDFAHADLVFNTLGEVEKSGGQFDAVATIYDELEKPVLNPIPAIARTGREQAPALFGAIPHLVVPGVRWIDRDDLARLTVDKPTLARPGGAHGGKDLALIQSADDIAAYLDHVPYHRFLLTDFHDFKAADGQYRKYRMIFVDREPYPYHLAIGDHWLVHYWRAEMGRSEAKKQEEEAFLTDWRAVFGPQGAAAVDAVARSLDLDYGGMDCSILPDGRVLFFEANACMLVHLDDSEIEFPYKHVAVPRIRDAVTRMVRNRVAR
jgi:tetratricopeptide (TPR) repeat protein